MRVGGDVIRIIVVNEIISAHREVHCKGKEREQQGDENWPGRYFHELSKIPKECRHVFNDFARF